MSWKFFDIVVSLIDSSRFFWLLQFAIISIFLVNSIYLECFLFFLIQLSIFLHSIKFTCHWTCQNDPLYQNWYNDNDKTNQNSGNMEFDWFWSVFEEWNSPCVCVCVCMCVCMCMHVFVYLFAGAHDYSIVDFYHLLCHCCRRCFSFTLERIDRARSKKLCVYVMMIMAFLFVRINTAHVRIKNRVISIIITEHWFPFKTLFEFFVEFSHNRRLNSVWTICLQ